MNRLPPIVAKLIGTVAWPTGRIAGSAFPGQIYFENVFLELTPTIAEIKTDSSKIAKRSTLHRISTSPGLNWSLYSSSQGTSKRSLPWLDLDSACVIGGGADYGDDLWLVLDLRDGDDDPPVVYNKLTHGGRSAKWSLLSRSTSEFILCAKNVKFQQ